MSKRVKNIVLIVMALVITFPFSSKAFASGQGAQDFVDGMGKRAISFLGDSSLSKTKKEQEFRKLLKRSFDMKTIGRFAMGRHWRTATPSMYGRAFLPSVRNAGNTTATSLF